MSHFDAYFSGDETIKKRNYKGYVLSKEDEMSLLDIEKTIAQHKVTRSNKKDLIEFLENIHKKISMIKRNEYEFEGENNLNVNEYLQRIQKLLQKIHEM